MTTSGTPDQGNGIAEAASAFEDILAGKAVTQDDEDTAPEDPADTAEAQGSESEDETPSDEEGAEDEEATANDEDAEEGEEQPAERMITVKIDGKVMEIPESEAAKGYQRQADYSRNMAVVMEERKALHQNYQEVQAERAQYAQLLTALQEQLAELQPQEPDWEQLYANDPLEFVRQKEVWRDRETKLQAAQAERQRIEYLQQQESALELQAKVAEGRQQLHAYNPAWKDTTKWEADRQKLRQYLGKTGYSEEEISRAYDPRAVTVAHKAMLYDELMAKRPQPVRQLGPKPATSGSAPMPARRHTDQAKAKMRLAKTGSVKDAAKVFEGLL